MNIMGGVIFTYVKQLEKSRAAARKASQMGEVEAGRKAGLAARGYGPVREENGSFRTV
jgi:hypothetical protein